MTDNRKQAFQPYLRKLADLMGLRDWTIGIMDEPPDSDNAIAENHPAKGRKQLWLCLSEGFLDKSPEEQRHALVHELVHGHTAPMHWLMCKILRDENFIAYDLAMEYMVDGIAEEWAKYLPLPKESDGRFQ